MKEDKINTHVRLPRLQIKFPSSSRRILRCPSQILMDNVQSLEQADIAFTRGKRWTNSERKRKRNRSLRKRQREGKEEVRVRVRTPVYLVDFYRVTP